MPRIAGIDLPGNKRTEIALTYIYGVGHSLARQICKKAFVDGGMKLRDLTEDELTSLRKVIETEYKIEGELRQIVRMNIKRLMDIGAYRGLRHRRGLPVRGQRTHTNARTRKGPKKNVIGGRKKK